MHRPDNGTSMPRYTLVDSSVFSHLVKSRTVGVLGSPKFQQMYGKPFITMHNFLELAGVDEFEQFRERVQQISSVENLVSINTDSNGYPGQIVDIVALEIEGIVHYRLRTLSELREYILSKVLPIRRDFSDPELRFIFAYAKQERTRNDLLATANPYMFNQYYDVPLSRLESYILDLSDDRRLAPFLDTFYAVITSRGVSSGRADSIKDFFESAILSQRDRYKVFNSILQMLRATTGEEPDLDRSIHYYTNLMEFRGRREKIRKMMRLNESEAEAISMDDTFTYRLSITLRDNLQKTLAKDTPRAIELSNVNDLYLASFSYYLHVIVDKRTYELLSQTERDIAAGLYYQKVNYTKLKELSLP